MLRNLMGGVLACVLATSAFGQFASTQTIPNGFLGTDPTGSSAFPINDLNDHIWQWHYDSAQFVTQGPITICGIAVRASTPTATVNAFDFPSFDVTLSTALTDYAVGNHDPIFANNLAGDATLVHTGQWAGGPVGPSGQTTADWIEIPMSTTFDYDPTAGDFIVQIVKCGTTAPWGTSLDGVTGGAGAVGGNRYGVQNSCTATTSTFQNNEFVPVVRITYVQGPAGTCLPLPPGEFQLNQAGAALTLSGLPEPGQFSAIFKSAAVGSPETLDISSVNAGLPWDLGIRLPGTADPFSVLNIITPGFQVVNIDIFTPGTNFLFGGALPDLVTTAFPPVPTMLPFALPVPTVGAAQMVVVDPSLVDGIALSHAAQYSAELCSTTQSFDGLTANTGAATAGGPYPIGWSNGPGTAQWQVRTGTTTSAGTGPIGGAFSPPNYMYCETSSPNTNATFIMDTCAYDATALSNFVLNFRLSRIGATIGTLNVLMDDGSGAFATTLATYTGPEPTSTDWTAEAIPFTPSGPLVAFRFEYTAANNFTGDIAIDDFDVN